MRTRIDHFMYATPSLEEGMTWAADTFGVQPTYAGEHIGLGTRNALLSLGSAYLEIIAPDPAQPLEGTLGELFSALSRGGLLTWAAEGDLALVQQVLLTYGIPSAGPKQTQRRTPEGGLLEWALLFPLSVSQGARMPFFIDWQRCVNPRQTSPQAGTFVALSITSPDADDLGEVLSALDLEVAVVEGLPGLEVVITSSGREITLVSTEETSSISLT
ncbi:MAG: VOC family protein [bacterium]